MDWCTEQILGTLDRLGIADNTLVIFSSDNGPVIDDGYHDDSVEKLGDHKPAGPWRGGKYSNFEAGTRVPFVVRWPARIAPGQVSGALVCQVDFPATFAALIDQSLGPDEAPDSLNILPALLGETKTGRDHLVQHARGLALRQGTWKYIEPTKGPAVNQNTRTELGGGPAGSLYDLATDPGERINLIDREPQRAAAMAAKLREIQEAGRSR